MSVLDPAWSETEWPAGANAGTVRRRTAALSWRGRGLRAVAWALRHAVFGTKGAATPEELSRRAMPREADDLLMRRRHEMAVENVVGRVPRRARLRPAAGAPVPCEWIEMPSSDATRIILYVHGGSYIVPRTDLHTGFIARVCEAAGVSALMVDYRVAPEHPFPAALDDVTVAYRWLLGRGVAPERIVILGDSAGGGLALSALLALKRGGVAMPAGAALLCPWADMTFSGASMLTNARQDPLMYGIEALAICRHFYLQGHSPGDPLVSPVFADLGGLPPLMIQAGSTDILRDDAVRIAEAARAAGGDAVCDVFERMPHGWQRMGSVTAEGRQAIADVGAFVRRQVSCARASASPAEERRDVGT